MAFTIKLLFTHGAVAPYALKELTSTFCCLYLHRALEAMLIIVATTYVVYFCAMFLGTCVPFALDKGSGVVS